MTNEITQFKQNARIHADVATLESEHDRAIITNFYRSNPSIPSPPRALYVFSSWSQLTDNPQLTASDCVFVDGGILEKNLDLGNAIVINDGGIREGSISCGRFHADGGITEGVITEHLLSRPATVAMISAGRTRRLLRL